MNEKEISVCTLCNSSIFTVEYNLKFTCSSYSKSPLIDFIKEMSNGLTNYNICHNCWMLFEELDSLILKQNIIYDKFRQYIFKRENEDAKTSVVDTKFLTLDNKQEGNDVQEQINNFKNPQTTTVDPKQLIQLECSDSKQCNSEHEMNTCLLTTDTQRQFVCEICGQAYKNKSNFKIHKDMHNGVSHFKCSYCNKSFTQRAALNRHMPMHTGQKPHQCDQCGKTYTHHTSFNLHKMTHSAKKPYKCSACTSAFSSLSHLKRHMKIHTGEKTYICAICGKKFAEKYNLSVHERTHKNQAHTKERTCTIIRAKTL